MKDMLMPPTTEAMRRNLRLAGSLRIWKDARGQDLIEYALMAGLIAMVAVAILPSVAAKLSQIFSRVSAPASTAAPAG
jgi:pilus assembly protein Flp/PilA